MTVPRLSSLPRLLSLAPPPLNPVRWAEHRATPMIPSYENTLMTKMPFIVAVILAFVGCSRDSTPSKLDVGAAKKTDMDPKATDKADKPDESLSSQEPLTINAHAKWVSSVSFSADGKMLASVGKHEGNVKLWDAVTGTEIKQLVGHTLEVDAVAFAPSGNTLASSGTDGEVKQWDISTGLEQATLSCGFSVMRPITFSNDGKRLASGGEAGKLKIWDVEMKKEKIALKGHKFTVLCVAFFSDGKSLASGGTFDGVKIWNTVTGEESKTIRQYSKGLVRPVALGPVQSVAFHPIEKTVVTAAADRVTLWDSTTGEEQFTFKGHTDAVLAVAFSPDGRRVISGAADKTLRLWDVETQIEVTTFTGASDPVTCVAYSRDGKKVAAGSEDGTIRIYVVAKR